MSLPITGRKDFFGSENRATQVNQIKDAGWKTVVWHSTCRYSEDIAVLKEIVNKEVSNRTFQVECLAATPGH